MLGSRDIQNGWILSATGLVSRTFDAVQLQTLTNVTNVSFMTPDLLFGVLFGPEESFDPTSFEDKDGQAITITS
jgi:hypothetical protein